MSHLLNYTYLNCLCLNLYETNFYYIYVIILFYNMIFLYLYFKFLFSYFSYIFRCQYLNILSNICRISYWELYSNNFIVNLSLASIRKLLISWNQENPTQKGIFDRFTSKLKNNKIQNTCRLFLLLLLKA